MKLEMIKVGRIVNAHGIKGEVRVQPRDADPYFLTEFDTFYMDGKPVTPTANHVHKSIVLMKCKFIRMYCDGRNCSHRRTGSRENIRSGDIPHSAVIILQLILHATDGNSFGFLSQTKQGKITLQIGTKLHFLILHNKNHATAIHQIAYGSLCF